MKSLKNGKNTSRAEVTNISEHGFWMLINGSEYFLPFEKFPWFADATIKQISHFEIQGEGHVYWADLDIDLSIKIIENPDNYKLISK